VQLPTSLPANPAAQQSTPQPFDVDDHESIGLVHFRHRMLLQSQLLSEKPLDEHLDPSSGWLHHNSPQKDYMDRGFRPSATCCI
jgi:hypothetical protein